MELQEVISKVKQLEIVSKKLTQHLFAGEYHSAFKGRGMSFKEVRDYQPGDDIRFIDWNVSARFNHTFSKVFEEERELTVHFVIDVSNSNLFGTRTRTKIDAVAEITAVLAFAALKNNDKVGLTLFASEIEKYIAPNKGRKHVLHIVRDVLLHETNTPKTNITKALQFINNTTKQRSIVFIISDFLDHEFETALKATAKKHDVIGLRIYDELEMNLPKVGLLNISDLETGESKLIQTNMAWVRLNHKNQFVKHTTEVQEIFNKCKSDLLHLKSDEDYVKILQQFFYKRLKRA